ncbi:MAG: UvrD-helicase domain-containing protein [Gammaproteobacteria bacterium]|nr:UvrD-helicase domain-containing protein [Gammaproteobacteria bacterium]NNF60508.1 UvrD-helicase domain-containing protein [Gammaproteobacteria bacterium]
MPISSALNPRQRAAVTHVDTPLLVLAGAGSGKTRVIVHKIAHLIKNGGISPDNIAAVTFTNKAAKEMRERVAALLGESAVSELRVSTFHTLGLNILRREYDQLGYRQGFSIFDAADSLALLQELQKRDGDDAATEQAQWTISGWKSALIGPAHALKCAEDALEAGTARLYAAYQRSLKAYNGVDFDDLILQPVALFQDNPEVLAAWQERIRYLLADEYQDTNLAQYQLLRLLAGTEGRFTVVGDDDQSIYTWRGANPENLNQLAQDYPQLEVVKLEQNYRSSGNILATANHLIANNQHLFDKKLWSANGPGENIKVIALADEHAEVERVVTDLFMWRLDGRGNYGDCAVLYRGNHQARLFEQALRLRRIPYHLSGGRSFFDRTEVRDVMAYLRLVANPDNDTAFLRIVNKPRREIGATTLENLTGLSAKQNCSLLAAIRHDDAASVLPGRSLSITRRFAELIDGYTEAAERGALGQIAQELVEEIDYVGWLRRSSKDAQLAERRVDNVEALLDWVRRIAKANPDISLAELLAQLSLAEQREDDEPDGGQVRLMTLHAAKGLEFDHVHLVGFEEGLLPHHQNLEGPGVDEERRLAYVGITRAKRQLVITYAAERRRYGESAAREPSRFLDELPQDRLEWVLPNVGTEIICEEQRDRGNQALAEMRALLSGDP